METVLKIRRMHQVDGQSISAIAKVTGLSRNTVRKYLEKRRHQDGERLLPLQTEDELSQLTLVIFRY